MRSKWNMFDGGVYFRSVETKYTASDRTQHKAFYCDRRISSVKDEPAFGKTSSYEFDLGEFYEYRKA